MRTASSCVPAVVTDAPLCHNLSSRKQKKVKLEIIRVIIQLSNIRNFRSCFKIIRVIQLSLLHEGLHEQAVSRFGHLANAMDEQIDSDAGTTLTSGSICRLLSNLDFARSSSPQS